MTAANETEHPNPEPILKLGMGFFASKTLLSAIELGVFTELARGPLTGKDLAAKLSLHPRSSRDFFDTLVALGMLKREGDQYTNTPTTDTFLDRNKPSYIGGLCEMLNARLYGFWGSLTEALRTGQPQNEIKTGGQTFDAIYSDPDRLKGFLKAMTGVSMGSAMAIAEKFPWQNYKSFIDIGTAEGCVPVAVARRHPHLTGGGFDLPVVQPHFENYVAANGLTDRVQFHAGDFFNEDLPSAEVLIFGHILHDWSMEEKMMLLKKAHAALPEGGAVLVYDAIIDDDRSQTSSAFS